MNLSKVIELNNVTKRYGSNTALYDINLSIETGKIIGLLGPNGSGKTTLMKTLMRIIREQEGTIKICGNLASYETRKFISFMPITIKTKLLYILFFSSVVCNG